MDIRPINSVMAGMEVTVSKTDITYNGWTGCGYIVINPVTGSGGYMISGGTSGAVFFGAFLIVLGMFLLGFVPLIPFAITLIVHGILLMAVGVQLLAKSNNSINNCLKAFMISYGTIVSGLFSSAPLMIARLTVTMFTSIDRVSRSCFGEGIAS